MSNPDHDEGGSAFPVPETESLGYIPGMTLRDYFAGQMLASSGWDMLVIKLNQPDVTPDDAAKLVARTAYELADAMIDARKVFNG